MSWGAGDDQEFSNTMSTFDSEEGAVDAFTASLEESFESGPMKSLYRFAGAAVSNKNMTGAEANEKYNLADTDIAYDDNAPVSEFEAKIAADRYFQRRINEARIANASEEPMGTIASFAGSLTGGFVDPVNIATGVGIGAAVKSASMVSSLSGAFKNAIKNPWIESTVRNGIENLAGSLAVDLVAVPLGETVTRENTSNYQRMMNVIGGTVMGTGLGVGMEAKGIMRTARALVREKGSVHGSKAPEVMQEANEHALKNFANNKKPNPAFVEEKHNIINTTKRPGQQDYVQVELNRSNVAETDFFVGKGDQVIHGGDSGFVISDNANLVSNRVTPLDGTSSEMQAVRLKKDAKIVTQDVYEELNDSLPSSLSKTAIENGYKGNEEALTNVIKQAMDETSSIDDMINSIDDLLGSFEGVPEAAELMNKSISKLGYDGYRLSVPHENGGNAIVVFNKADGTRTGIDTISDPIPTQAFDKNHPDAKNVLGKLSEHNQKEMQRLGDYRSDLDYEAEAVSKADNAPDMDTVESEDFDNLVESYGLDKDNIAEEGFSEEFVQHAEALKNANSHEVGGKALMNCVIQAFKG